MNNQNISVAEFCREHYITEAQFYGKESIEKNLDWEHLEYLPDGISLEVKGYICLKNLKWLPPNTKIKSDKAIRMYSLTMISENCELRSAFWDLILSSVTTLSKNCIIYAVSDLVLNSLTIIHENCKLSVGGNLYLDSLSEIPKHYTIDVKGKIFLQGD